MTVSLRCDCAFFLEKLAIIKCCLWLPESVARHLDTTVKYLGILDDQLMEASREFYEKHSDLYGIKNLL